MPTINRIKFHINKRNSKIDAGKIIKICEFSYMYSIGCRCDIFENDTFLYTAEMIRVIRITPKDFNEIFSDESLARMLRSYKYPKAKIAEHLNGNYNEDDDLQMLFLERI